MRICGEFGVVGQGHGGETKSRGEAKRDGEPGQTTQNVCTDGCCRSTCDGPLPVGLVEEDSARARTELDDAEDEGEV